MDESGDRRNVFSYCLKRLVLLIMIGDFQNGGNFLSVPTFPMPVKCATTCRALGKPIVMMPTSASNGPTSVDGAGWRHILPDLRLLSLYMTRRNLT